LNARPSIQDSAIGAARERRPAAHKDPRDVAVAWSPDRRHSDRHSLPARECNFDQQRCARSVGVDSLARVAADASMSLVTATSRPAEGEETVMRTTSPDTQLTKTVREGERRYVTAAPQFESRLATDTTSHRLVRATLHALTADLALEPTRAGALDRPDRELVQRVPFLTKPVASSILPGCVPF
jgi:hypothetical protein